VDFIRGAAEAIDGEGKPIIALPSVTNKGESKISPLIKHGKVFQYKVSESLR
jgi:acyl-CoA hydrolase